MDPQNDPQPNITIQPLDSLKIASPDMQSAPGSPPAPVPYPAAAGASDNSKMSNPSNQADAAMPSTVPLARFSYDDAVISEVEITKIAPNPFQPRKNFESHALKELADSIKERGVIQPLVVTKTLVGYELVVGERRFRAAVLAGLATVPAIVKEQMVDQAKLEVALIENIQRKELNPIEEAQAYERLMKTFNLTQEEVARRVGRSRPAVANTVRLLNLPAEVQRAVIEGRLMEGHARALLGLNDPEKILALYKIVIEKKWNVREVEDKVRELTQRKAMDSAAPDPKLMALESELRIKLGAQVKILRQGGGGKITIEFFSDEELNDIVGKMSKDSSAAGDTYLTV